MQEELTPILTLTASLITHGHSNAKIANLTGKKERTIERHVTKINQIWNTQNRVHIAVKAIQLGIVNTDDIDLMRNLYNA